MALASATEMSFTWLGFSTAMASNAAFAGRAIYSKNLMKRMSAVNLYNYVTIVALLFCIPPMLYVRCPLNARAFFPGRTWLMAQMRSTRHTYGRA